MARTLEQLEAVLAWKHEASGIAPATAYCDFEDIRNYKAAVAMGAAAGVTVGLATVRIIKPSELGLLKQVADCGPDVGLVRNLAGLAWFAANAPGLPLVGDYALNVANEVTAALFAEHGVRRMVPSYDLNFTELAAMVAASRRVRGGRPPAHADVPHGTLRVLPHPEHRHEPQGLRPAVRHAPRGPQRPRGAAHPLVADVGCRNTVFNGTAQSAAEYVRADARHGDRRLPRRTAARRRGPQVAPLLDRYARVLAGSKTAARRGGSSRSSASSASRGARSGNERTDAARPIR